MLFTLLLYHYRPVGSKKYEDVIKLIVLYCPGCIVLCWPKICVWSVLCTYIHVCPRCCYLGFSHNAEEATVWGDVSPSMCSPEQGTSMQLVPVVTEEDVIAPVGGGGGLVVNSPCRSSAPAGFLAVLLAGRRWEFSF